MQRSSTYCPACIDGYDSCLCLVAVQGILAVCKLLMGYTAEDESVKHQLLPTCLNLVQATLQTPSLQGSFIQQQYECMLHNHGCETC